MTMYEVLIGLKIWAFLCELQAWLMNSFLLMRLHGYVLKKLKTDQNSYGQNAAGTPRKESGKIGLIPCCLQYGQIVLLH